MAEESRRAGWYPDPDGATGERWWNGAGWSESRRGGSVPVATPMAVPSSGPTSTPAPTPPPVVYSAANPAPQRPDPYAVGRSVVWTGALVNATPGRNVDVSVNKYAFYGFVSGIISVFFNLLFLLAPLAIVFSIMGIVRARELRAQGAPTTLMTLALIGLGMGSLSLLIGLIAVIGGIASVIGSISVG